jgi:hypothetical protein
MSVSAVKIRTVINVNHKCYKVNIPEYNKRLGKVIQQTQNFDNGATMVKVGISAFSLLRQRVQESGTNAKGVKFAPYSTKPMLVGCKTFVQKSACNTVFGSREKRKSLEWRTVNGHHLAILPGGYKQVRELQGRQTAFVDFSVTNAMWNDIAVRKENDLVSKSSDHQRGIAIIGAKREEEKKKLAGNTKRKGAILDLNANEIEDLKLTYKIAELQIFKENGIN